MRVSERSALTSLLYKDRIEGGRLVGCTVHTLHTRGRKGKRERERRNGEEARGYGDEVLSLFLSFFLFLPPCVLAWRGGIDEGQRGQGRAMQCNGRTSHLEAH